MIRTDDFLDNEVIDLREEMALVSPTDTPLTTLLYQRGKVVKALDIDVSWREKELNADRGSLKAEGATAGEPIFSTRQEYHNLCQILEKVTQVSNTANATEPFGIDDPFEAEIADRLMEMKRDLEWYMINGTLTQEDDNNPRQMNGLFNLIHDSNIFTLNNRVITENDFLDVLQAMWEHCGSSEYYCFVRPDIKRAINKALITENSQVRQIMHEGINQTFGAYVSSFQSDFGDIHLMLSRHVPDDAALVVDLAQVEIAELRGTTYEALSSEGDYIRGHVINESTIKLLNGYAGAKIIFPNE